MLLPIEIAASSSHVPTCALFSGAITAPRLTDPGPACGFDIGFLVANDPRPRSRSKPCAACELDARARGRAHECVDCALKNAEAFGRAFENRVIEGGEKRHDIAGYPR
jgi:hypothetical protein